MYDLADQSARQSTAEHSVTPSLRRRVALTGPLSLRAGERTEGARPMGAEPTTATAVAAEVMQALPTPAGQADPYPHYARLRALGPP